MRSARTATFAKVDFARKGVWLQASCDPKPWWRVLVDDRQIGLFDSLDEAKEAARAIGAQFPADPAGA